MIRYSVFGSFSFRPNRPGYVIGGANQACLGDREKGEGRGGPQGDVIKGTSLRRNGQYSITFISGGAERNGNYLPGADLRCTPAAGSHGPITAAGDKGFGVQLRPVVLLLEEFYPKVYA